MLVDQLQNFETPRTVASRMNAMNKVPNFRDMLERLVERRARKAILEIALIVLYYPTGPVPLRPFWKGGNCVSLYVTGI